MKHAIIAALTLGMFGAVSSAEAQPHRRVVRDADVVVVRHGRVAIPRHHRTTHVRYAKAHHRRVHAASWELQQQKRDLRQIRDISRAWHHATARRSHYERQLIDQRLVVWLEREVRESHRRGVDPYFRARLYDLSRQLDALRWHSVRGRHRRHDDRRMARILDELVALSEIEVRRARNRIPYDARWSVAVR